MFGQKRIQQVDHFAQLHLTFNCNAIQCCNSFEFLIRTNNFFWRYSKVSTSRKWTWRSPWELFHAYHVTHLHLISQLKYHLQKRLHHCQKKGFSNRHQEFINGSMQWPSELSTSQMCSKQHYLIQHGIKKVCWWFSKKNNHSYMSHVCSQCDHVTKHKKTLSRHARTNLV